MQRGIKTPTLQQIIIRNRSQVEASRNFATESYLFIGGGDN